MLKFMKQRIESIVFAIYSAVSYLEFMCNIAFTIEVRSEGL
jgi:hypothetical protein